jgi:hypothetical protein
MSLLPKALCIALVSLVGCNWGTTGDCESTVTDLETSNGTFTYSASGEGGTDAAPVRGDLGASTGLNVASASSSLGIIADGDAGGAGGLDPSAIVVSGNLVYGSGDVQPFYLVVTGLAPGLSGSPVGPGSQACLEMLPWCTTLTGSIDTTTFATSCRGEDGCALTIAGSIRASTVWWGGSLSVDLTLDHQDSWGASDPCP